MTINIFTKTSIEDTKNIIFIKLVIAINFITIFFQLLVINVIKVTFTNISLTHLQSYKVFKNDKLKQIVKFE